MHYVYVLRSDVSGKYYIGQTKNIYRRVKQHRDGKSSFGKRNPSLEIVYKHRFNNCGEAKKFENFLKRQKSHKFIDKLIIGKVIFPGSSVGRASGCQ